VKNEGHAEDEHRGPHRRADGGAEGKEHDDPGESEDRARDPGADLIEPAPVEARDQARRDADEHGDADGDRRADER
jgi:hypothetical protein